MLAAALQYSIRSHSCELLITIHVLEGDQPDVHNDVDGVGQELQGELGLQEGVDLLHMVRDVLADILRRQEQWKRNKSVKPNRCCHDKSRTCDTRLQFDM